MMTSKQVILKLSVQFGIFSKHVSFLEFRPLVTIMALAVTKLSDVFFRPYFNFYSSKPSNDLKDKNIKKHDVVPKSLNDDNTRDPNVLIAAPEIMNIHLLRKEFDDLRDRVARISKPPKNCMQSGTHHINMWHLKFDTRERWENPNIGYISSADPLSSITLRFSTKEEALNFCEKNNWKCWTVDAKPKKMKKRTYAENFVYNKRSRVSTK